MVVELLICSNLRLSLVKPLDGTKQLKVKIWHQLHVHVHADARFSLMSARMNRSSRSVSKAVGSMELPDLYIPYSVLAVVKYILGQERDMMGELVPSTVPTQFPIFLGHSRNLSCGFREIDCLSKSTCGSMS